MGLQELEQAVAKLPEADLKAFVSWFEEYLADQWDRQIEADVASGRLEAKGQKADDNFAAGRCKPL